MREIKFRAWNKEIKIMGSAMPIDVLLMAHYNQELDTPRDLKHCILMQYTGLKDINGKEIFEGDVVKVGEFYIGDSKIKPITGNVIFENGGFYVNKDDEYHCDVCREDIHNYQVEIIGNIYENKELLK